MHLNSNSDNYNRNNNKDSSRRFSRNNRYFNKRNRSGFGRGRRKKFNQSNNLSTAFFIKKAKPIETIKEDIQHSFSDFPFCQSLHENISKKGFDKPTLIQDQSILPIMENKDLVGIANTGTGKTGAFLLPLIDKIYKNKKSQKVLVLAPTRELAVQIHNELYEFTKNMKIFSVLAIGGTSIYKQISSLKRMHDFVIGTPGRVKDLVNRNILDLNKYNNIVLDEVDRMLDMGFIDDIREILGGLPKERQSLFFSATMNKETEGLMSSFLNNPVKISVKTAVTSDNVEQDIIRYQNEAEKITLLYDLLKKDDLTKVLVFDKTKRGVDRLEDYLNTNGFRAVSIHGDKTQYHRSRALSNFKKGLANIMIATDVAARGLDIDKITHVINYDTPENYDTYTHRIGRTGRANQRGVAYTFIRV